MKPELREIFTRYDAVIFDMDGTLVDSMWVWEEIDRDFFRSRGMEFPDTLHKEIEGMSFTETAEYFVKTYHMAETVEEVKAVWNRMAMEKYRTKTPLKPGALPFFRASEAEWAPHRDRHQQFHTVSGCVFKGTAFKRDDRRRYHLL